MKWADRDRIIKRLTEVEPCPVNQDANPWPYTKPQEPVVMIGDVSKSQSDIKIIHFDKLELCSLYGSILHWRTDD